MSVSDRYMIECECNYAIANIYEAVYQIYQAVEDGRPYSGIDSFECAIGKKIERILVENSNRFSLFSKKANACLQPLYFVYDKGVLIVSQHIYFWTDTVLPDTDLVDVSSRFEGIAGHVIQRIVYGHDSEVKGTICQNLPIASIEMDSGCSIRFFERLSKIKKGHTACCQIVRPM